MSAHKLSTLDHIFAGPDFVPTPNSVLPTAVSVSTKHQARRLLQQTNTTPAFESLESREMLSAVEFNPTITSIQGKTATIAFQANRNGRIDIFI